MRIHIYVNVCPQCQVGSLGWQVGANGARIQIDDCVITANTSEDSQGRAEDITSRYLQFTPFNGRVSTLCVFIMARLEGGDWCDGPL